MTESSTGIQELMAAETRASQIVAEARIGKLCDIALVKLGSVQECDRCGISFHLMLDCCLKLQDAAIV